MSPRIKRLVKKCEDFYVCAEIGNKDAIGVEFPDDRKTMYQYMVHGRISLITIDNNKFTIKSHEANQSSRYQLIDVKEHLHHRLLLSAEEDFYMIGFNTLHKNIDWDGEIKKESFNGNNDSWLIIFDGSPIVNGKKMKRFDYAKLEDKFYDVTLNDGVIAVFTKKCLF